MREERDAIKSELGEKETAIATLTTENQKLEDRLAEAAKNEIFLSKELQRFKYGVVPSEESHGEQLQLFPTPEEPENDTTEVLQTEAQTTEEPPTVDPEPEEPENDTTETLQTEAQPKLYNPGQLAKWINENCNPDKKISDQNVRDWFNPKKNSDKKRTEVQEKYGFRLDHKDKKGTLWFTVG